MMGRGEGSTCSFGTPPKCEFSSVPVKKRPGGHQSSSSLMLRFRAIPSWGLRPCVACPPPRELHDTSVGGRTHKPRK